MRLTEPQLGRALDRVAPALEKYLWIMDHVRGCDVSTDATFQRRFNGFYRVRKSATWQAPYYALMERAKAEPLTFAEVLRALHEQVGRIEASFTSKLVATLDPWLPVLDQIVLQHLGLRMPAAHEADRLAKTCTLFEALCERYAALLASPEGRLICQRFQQRYPHAELTDVKRIDLVLWQHRP
jgi:hypothetical protein